MATSMPPKQLASIPLRDQPGWITFSLDGRYAWCHTPDVIDARTRKIVATLKDENVAFFQIGLFRETSDVPESILIDHVVEATTLKEVTPPPLPKGR